MLPFFSALTLLVGSFDPHIVVPDMTYNVFGGTLSLTQSTGKPTSQATLITSSNCQQLHDSIISMV